MNDQRDDQAIQTSDGFGGETTSIQRETASTAMAERAKAQITARYIMAIQRPRNDDLVRQKLLKDCRRTSFANSAIYSVPRGRKQDDHGNWVDNYIEGPSIRFAEAAIRAMTNVLTEVNVISEDSRREVLHIAVTDLECNATYETEVIVPKTTERQKLRKGQRPISQRTNSFDKVVYLVEATEDDMTMKRNALVSKALRTLLLRLVPGDLLDDAVQLCKKTSAAADKQDPDKARKDLLDAFFGVGVPADQVALYVGHSLDTLVGSEISELRAVFAAIREGDVTWHEALASKTGEVEAGEGADEATAQQQRTAVILAEKRKEQAAAAEAKKAKTGKGKKSEPKAEAPPPAEQERQPGED